MRCFRVSLERAALFPTLCIVRRITLNLHDAESLMEPCEVIFEELCPLRLADRVPSLRDTSIRGRSDRRCTCTSTAPRCNIKRDKLLACCATRRSSPTLYVFYHRLTVLSFRYCCYHCTSFLLTSYRVVQLYGRLASRI